MGSEKYKKDFWRFWGAVGGILLGGWIIFKLNNIWGFIPALVGLFFLLKANGNK